MAAAVVGMERIALLVGRCAVYEQLYLGTEIDVVELAKGPTNDLRNAILVLYVTILQVLSRLKVAFNSNNPT